MRVLPIITALLAACLAACFVDTGQPAPDSDSSGAGSTTDPTTTGETAVCGDGFRAGAELCDLGPLNGLYAACGPLCLPNYCGDGLRGPSETCDDGNMLASDACGSDCKPARCGDEVLQDGEDCDDGNTAAGDGCSPRCFAEII